MTTTHHGDIDLDEVVETVDDGFADTDPLDLDQAVYDAWDDGYEWVA